MASLFDDDYFIAPLSPYSHTFPDPRYASTEGLMAYGGDLDPNRILKAYRSGIFPWYSPGDPILWWSPDPRMILEPGKMIVRKSFRKKLRNASYRVSFDRDFPAVIEACASVPRPGQEGTWLTPEMKSAYIGLYEMGFAHSVEVWMDGQLAGGLYGLALGGAFFGESMFSRRSDGSKIALKALSDVLSERCYDFVDCQVVTEHLLRLGARTIPRDEFLERLDRALQKPGDYGSWSNFRWEYGDD